MTYDEAIALLGESATVSAEALRHAFARCVKASHPDTGGDNSVSIQSLREARAVLLAAIEKRDNACVPCHGTGKVRGVVGVRRCAACDGTGDRGHA